MTTYVTDYSWARPNPAAIAAAGFAAVCRYLSRDKTGKTLTQAEADALHAAGLGIVLNFEDSASRPLAGAAAGAADARFADALADQLGAPRNVPIYYSCDTDPGSPVRPAIAAYFSAVKAASVRPVGVYGGAVLVKWALDSGVAQYGWTANASSWNHGVHPAGHIQQLYAHPAGTPLIVGTPPNHYDVNVVLNPNFGAWGGTNQLSEEDFMALSLAQQMLLVRANEETAELWNLLFGGVGHGPDKNISFFHELRATLAGINSRLSAIETKLGAPVPSAAVDAEAEAKAVADELARRLES